MAEPLKDTYYKTKDGRIVGEDDPDAAILIGTKGARLSPSQAARYGIDSSTGRPKVDESQEPAKESGSKQRSPQENK